jgi:hypothetical protein
MGHACNVHALVQRDTQHNSPTRHTTSRKKTIEIESFEMDCAICQYRRSGHNPPMFNLGTMIRRRPHGYAADAV